MNIAARRCYSCTFVVFAFVCAFQSVSGRPDLGLNGEIKGSATAVDNASLASMLLNLLSDYTFVLGAGYPLLESMSSALFTIAGTLAREGSTMANGVALLAGDSSGIVAPAFQDAIAGVDNMLTLLSAGFPQEYEALVYRDKTYIVDMLNDNFKYFTEKLTTLSDILAALQPDIEQAQASAGGDGQPVSIKLIRRSVSPRLVNSLLNTVTLLPGAVSPFLYSIDNSLAHADQADTYILTVKSNIEDFLLQARQEVVYFNGNLRQLKTDTVDVIDTVDTSYQEQQNDIDQMLPMVQAASTFSDNLEGALLSFEQTVSVASITEKTDLLENEVANYISIAKTFGDDLVTFYGDRICPAVITVAEVLAASGPYADYCFHKFSPSVLNLAAHHYYDITECFALELNRIYSLRRLIGDLVNLVSFNYGELYDDILVCWDEQPCPGDACNACVKTLGEVLDTLSRLANEKFDLILQAVPTELDASLQRLESCAAFAKYKLIADAHDLISKVYDCEESGYHQ